MANFLENVIGLIILLAMVLVLLVFRVKMCQNNISCGYVTGKKIVYIDSNLFREASMEYKLYIKGEYTVLFINEPLEGERVFTVSEEIYYNYEIGDYFDSQNLFGADYEGRDNCEIVK